ncbi:MAG TPA: TatD family hydrolase [Candidatus Acidoferrales bacterium]|nr:TatD family hydrolase [Candidatus Acidoferrales bacterium]
MSSPGLPSLVDSHAHIQGPEFNADRGAVLERARAAGVETIVVVGGAGELASNNAAVELAQNHPGLFATVGIHPHDAKKMTEADFDRLRDLARAPRVVAVGETGLDFYYDHSPREVQIAAFSRFIALAQEIDLPLVVHDRDAHDEINDLLRREGGGRLRGVIHCFTGDYGAAVKFLDLGFFLSFSGIVTFKNADGLREVVKKVPLERILVETDSPYLAPVPHRGRRNEPAWVRYVAQVVAGVRQMPLEELIRATARNARQLFGLEAESLTNLGARH